MSKKKKIKHAGRASLPPAQVKRVQPHGRHKSILRLIAGVLLLIIAIFYVLPSLSKKSAVSNNTEFPAAADFKASAEVSFTDFVGAQTCAGCHTEEYEAWRSSTHARAGGPAQPQTVIGPFNGDPLQFKDAAVTPAYDAARGFTFTVKQEGAPPRVFPVEAVIGGGHMRGGGTQSYFAKFPDGTFRFLPFDYSKHEQRWFVQRRSNQHWTPVSRDLALTDLNEWPPHRILGTETSISNCQNCHGSQIEVTYDAKHMRFATRYQSLAINCESCHGPGKQHAELAHSGKISETADIGMKSLSTLSKEESLQICLQCHAVKDPLRAGYLPGRKLEDYYSLKLPLLAEGPYLADGRVRHFAYQDNHRYSDCYLNGSMTCVDCHDPHAQHYRDVTGRRLSGRFDNEQCLGCHASKRDRLEQHTKHKQNSAGSLCTSCHMPYLQHRGIGDQIRFARSDHSIPIPRPAFDAQLGIENACRQCHPDKSIAALEAQVNTWYGELKPHKRIVQGLLEIDPNTNFETAAQMLLQPEANHAMAQMAAVSYFAKTFLRPNMTTTDTMVVRRLKAFAQSPDLDLKALGLMSLHYSFGKDAEVRSFLIRTLRDLGENEHAVRSRWALALDYLGTQFSSRGDFANALEVFQMALAIKPDDPFIYVNQGNAYGNRGDLNNAIRSFQNALASDSTNVMALTNLGTAYAQQRNTEAAIAAYNKAIHFRRHESSGYLLLARFYLELGRFEEARATLNAGITTALEASELRWLLREIERM